MGTQVAKGAVSSDGVVVLAVAFDQNLGPGDRGAEFTVQEFVSKE